MIPARQMISLSVDVFVVCPYKRDMFTPALSRAGRALLDWSQEELATASHLGVSTVRDFERGRRVPTVNNLAAIRRALEEAGVEFLPNDALRLRTTATSARRTAEPAAA